jgi:cytoskeletal protein CcmA (bactofilin family)
MFGKDRKAAKLETIIGNDSCVKGEMTVKGTLRIDGAIEGEVYADWVIVGETGRVRGNIRSKGTIVGGVIDGNVDSDEIVELKEKAQVVGEIVTRKLTMSEGAIFEGHSCMRRLREENSEEGGIRALLPSSSAS